MDGTAGAAAFQWYQDLNGTVAKVAGATGPGLAVGGIGTTTPAAAKYYVVASDAGGTATSSEYSLGPVLSANAPIVQQTGSLTISAGGTATFVSFAAPDASGGSVPVSWYMGTPASGTMLNSQYSSETVGTGSQVATSTLTLNDVQLSNGGSYYSQAAYSGVASDSSLVTLAVVGPTEPATALISAGDGVTFTAAVTGASAPTYQWTCNGSPIPGATAASYSIPNVQVSASGSYSVTVTIAGSSASSRPRSSR